MAVLSSSRATPMCTCPVRRPRWCPLDSPWRLEDYAFRLLQIVGFPQLLPGYPIGPQQQVFRGSVTRPIHSLRLASHTPLQDTHAGSLQIRRLTSSGGNWAVTCLHPLGNIIQFHELLSDPKDPNLTRHEKQQLLIVNRSRKRAPNLTVTDRILLGFWSLFLGPRRIRQSAVIIKPSTLLRFHEALKKKRKYQLLYSSRPRGNPGPKGPSQEIILVIVGYCQLHANSVRL
jgi:hypothetical protein